MMSIPLTYEVLFDVISSHSALSGPGNDGQRFAHLQSTIQTDIGREEFGRGMAAFLWKIVDEPDAFPPKFWQSFLKSGLTALGGNSRPVFVGITWRRLLAAGGCGWRRPINAIES